MKREIEFLRVTAESRLQDLTILDFRSRTQIERALFVVCKGVVAEKLNANLSSLEAPTVERILSEVRGGNDRQDVENLLTRAVVLKRALHALASGDSYQITDIAGASLPGRAGAILAFRTGLDGFVQRVTGVVSGIDGP